MKELFETVDMRQIIDFIRHQFLLLSLTSWIYFSCVVLIYNPLVFSVDLRELKIRLG